MTQQSFNEALDRLANTIVKEYHYKDEDLRSKIFNTAYDKLDHNFEDFDYAVVSFSPLNKYNLEAKVEIVFQKQVIQTIDIVL